MKELHNHIFSNTTCISKETMLRHINKQLQKNELYEVEKHMLDCELCSDAYEGMKYAKNSSILFAIDNQIDQRVSKGNYKAPIMRNLMVAASLLVIIFGAYFSISYFNNTIKGDNNLALNNIKEVIPIEEKAVEKSGEIKSILSNQENLTAAATSEKDATILEEEKLKEDDKYRTVVNEVSPIMAEQPIEIVGEVSDDFADKIEVLEDEEETVVVVSDVSGVSANLAKGENDKLLESLDANIDNRREDNVNLVDQPVTNSVSTEGASLGYVQPEIDNSKELLKKEVKKSKNKTRNTGNKKRAKSNAKAPAFGGAISIEDLKGSSDRNQQNTITIDSYKVVDYTEEFQKEYDLKQTIDTKTVTADFETKADKDIAEKERDNAIVEITYKETLEKAIALYKNQKYTAATEQFDIILKEHPEEVNGWFYGGLSDYHLQRYSESERKLNKVLTNRKTEFQEEATWYKALILIELKQVVKAKKILKEIIAKNGFYKTKAEEKLKEL